MSIGTPNGILDITGATLRVSKMEFRQSTGFDTVLNNVARNTMLLMDDTEQTTSNSWALKLPNAWVAEFHGYWASGSSGAPILFNFYNDSTSGTNGYTLSMNDTAISINYDGGSALGSATLSSTLNTDAYRKVAVIFERSVLDVSVDGEHVFHFADSQLRDRVYDNNSGYVTFTHSSTDERKLKNLKFTNGDKWVREIDSSNIAYVGGNVGIGTTIPGTKLDVSGTVRGTHLMGDGSAISAIQSSNVSDFGSNVTRIGTLETDLGDNSTRITNLSSNLSDNSSRITALESGDTSISGDKTFTGDVVFESNVHMNGGNVFVANTVNLTVSDPIIELGSNNSGTNDLGIIMTRPNNNSNVAVVFDESDDILRMGYTLNGANDSIVDLDSNALAVGVQGALSAASVSGDGSGLTDLNASNISTGALSTTSVTIDDYLIHDGDTDTKVGFPSADTFTVTTANSERLRVDSSGDVGIGTTSPSYTLDVRGGLAVSYADDNAMKIDGGGTLRRHYTGSGNNYGAGLHFTSDAIWPTNYAGTYVNNQIDLGHSNYKWKGVHTEYLSAGGSGAVPATFTSSATWQTAVNIANSTVPNNTWSFLLGGSGNSTSSAGVGSLGFYCNNGTGFVMNLNANGNVGIGTTSPGAPLEITSTRNTESWSNVNSMFNVLHNNGNGAYYGMSFGVSANHGDGVIQTYNVANGNAQYDLRLQPNGGNVGIGTVSPQDLLHMYGASDSTLRIETNTGQAQILLRAGATTRRACRIDFSRADNGSQYMQIIGDYQQNATDDLTIASSTSGRIMTWLQSGNVGIGTTSPQGALHVAGNSGSSNTSKVLGVHMGVYASTYAHIEIVSSGSNTGWIDFKNANTGGNGDHSERIRGGSGHLEFITNMAERMRINSSGYVGIGTNNPLCPLDVPLNASGTISVNQYQGGYWMSWNTAGTQFYNSPTATVAGNFDGGSVTAHTFYAGYSIQFLSDRRIKKDIREIDDETALEKFRLLKPSKYKYIEPLLSGRTDKEVYGFIAQEVAEVLPEGVTIGGAVKDGTNQGHIPNIMSMCSIESQNISSDAYENLGTEQKGEYIETGNTYTRYVVTITKTIDPSTFNVDGSTRSYKFVEQTNTTGAFDKNSDDKYHPLVFYGKDLKTMRTNVVRVIDDSSFVVDKKLDLNQYEDDELLLYGQRPDDFYRLNKDAIFTLASAALQEVDRQLQDEKTKTATLETQVAALLARVTALENA